MLQAPKPEAHIICQRQMKLQSFCQETVLTCSMALMLLSNHMLDVWSMLICAAAAQNVQVSVAKSDIPWMLCESLMQALFDTLQRTTCYA